MVYVSHYARELQRIANVVVQTGCRARHCHRRPGNPDASGRSRFRITHVPEKWEPVFRSGHAYYKHDDVRARIVCLTEETVETLYLLGEDHRIVGVSGYAVRPSRVRKEKPRVSAFISADVPKILALKPDLVLTFSDLQADIVASLIRAGVEVHAFNQRDVAGIFAMIETLGALVDAVEKAEDARAFAAVKTRFRRKHHPRPTAMKPRVYFEEWDEPMISGIRWVSELIEIAGGVDVFPELSRMKSATERIVTPDAVIAASPDIIIGSWCGKKFVPAKVAGRAGFDILPAVRDRLAARDQVAADPATGARRSNRRPRRDRQHLQ